MNQEKFTEAWKQLNPAQQQAVESIEGPVMVAAGPGTGKTQILAMRIANIIRRTDIGPEGILALTFTDSGVIAMRRRLAELIGPPAYRVKIATFHSFCNELITDYPEYFPAITGGISLDELGQWQILEEIVSVLPLGHLTSVGDPLFYLKAIQNKIELLKREGLSPEEVRQFVDQAKTNLLATDDLYHSRGRYQGKMKAVYAERLKQFAKIAELADIYEAYQRQLNEAQRYDYNDMILSVKQVLQDNQDFRLQLQERFQYFLVDEHQDTNRAQNQVLELLADFYEQPNLFVVGDEKQAIYKFQGASLENFRYFCQRYPATTYITLTENYRSNQLILDVAQSLLASDQKLRAQPTAKTWPIKRYEFSHTAVEDYFLASEIKRLIATGVPAEEIAVLYRHHRDLGNLPKLLARSAIPYVVEGASDLLQDNDIKKLVCLLEAVNDFGSVEKFFTVLHLDFLGFKPIDVYRLASLLKEQKIVLWDLIQQAEKQQLSPQLDWSLLTDIYQRLSDLALKAKNLPLADFFEALINESGFLSAVLAGDNKLLAIRKLNNFFNQIKTILANDHEAQLPHLIKYLNDLQQHQLRIKTRPDQVAGRVRLLTAHRAKGREFDQVFIIRAVDGHWGNKRVIDLIKLPPELFALIKLDDQADKNDDDRRLFYVALTRARYGLTISSSQLDESDSLGMPTMFLGELADGLVELGDSEPWEKELTDQPEKLLLINQDKPVTAGGRKDFTSEELALVRHLFDHQALAVTHLNNYLSCPWKYFYRNLLRLPEAQTTHQLYGTAIHGALKDFFGHQHHLGGISEQEFLVERFRYYLKQKPLLAQEAARLLARGERELAGYVEAYHGQWHEKVICEQRVQAEIFDPPLRLRGDIDKIEILSDRGEVRVVDYKTGLPKSAKQLAGLTKQSSGDEKRQLVFYRLLLQSAYPGKYQVRSGQIDFLRPDKQGKYHKVELELDAADVEKLQDRLKQMVQEIHQLSFWHKTCGRADCQYCQWRQMMSPLEPESA